MGKIKLPLLIAIIVVIVVVVLAIILFPSKEQTGGGVETTSLKDVNIAKEIYGFSGEIKAIKNKILTLEASIPLEGEEAGLTKANVKIAVSEQTKLTKMKFPAEPDEENKPVFPEETALNFEELKIGDKINLAFGENVSDKLKAGEEIFADDLFVIEK